MNAGRPQKQALAIAYSVKRRAGKKMAAGGVVEEPTWPMQTDDAESEVNEMDAPSMQAQDENMQPSMESHEDEDVLSQDANMADWPEDESSNEHGSDEGQSTEGVLTRIMGQIRKRNMGRY